MKVVVAGGSGFIGRALRESLVAEGTETIVLSREAPREGEGFASWDARQPGAWIARMEGADAVVNLAGASVAEGRWSAERKEELLGSRVCSTRALVRGMAWLSRRPKVFICASAVGYYGNRGSEELFEDSGAGGGFLSGLCAQWEKEALQAAELGVRTIHLRVGVVLHPEGGALPRMIAPFRIFFGGPLGSGAQWMSWIAREDLIRLIRHLIGSRVAGPVNAVSPGPVTNLDFSRELGRALRRPSWLKTPGILLKGGLGEMADELLLASQRAYPRRALESGFSFLYPELRGAFDAMLKPAP